MDDSEPYDPDGDTHRYLYLPESPSDPLISSGPTFSWEYELFRLSSPPFSNNDVGLITSNQAAAPMQANVPSRTIDNNESLIRESDLLPETDFGGSSQLSSAYATGTEGRGAGLTGPKKKKTGIAAQRERTKNMTKEELEQYFDLPRERAAQELGISLTTLKKLCRKYGIPCWPYKRP
ncbi:protein RKD4-like [Phoenix dactylifera]|uniref:Protein RKD4-like n=1 Tax=Phoenix dactylifera TaxID=42345 RepID=A0A8B9ANH6_PHODC|nr:protein RKD4-like [Phoenix dactylifera]